MHFKKILKKEDLNLIKSLVIYFLFYVFNDE